MASAPSDDADSIAAELGLTGALTHDELNRARRRFMWNNHPDRRPDVPRELANRRVAIANMLVDRAQSALARAPARAVTNASARSRGGDRSPKVNRRRRRSSVARTARPRSPGPFVSGLSSVNSVAPDFVDQRPTPVAFHDRRDASETRRDFAGLDHPRSPSRCSATPCPARPRRADSFRRRAVRRPRRGRSTRSAPYRRASSAPRTIEPVGAVSTALSAPRLFAAATAGDAASAGCDDPRGCAKIARYCMPLTRGS